MLLSDFQTQLDENRAWRKLELSQARGLAESRVGTGDEAYLCRAWTLMMYAHCDQYIKELARLYIQYLRTNPRNAYDYTSIWLAFKAKEILLKGKDENYHSCKNLHNIDKNVLFDAIASKEVFEKQSFNFRNLRFFSDWILQIEFDTSEFQGFCTTLKTKRDQIAHGERVYVESIKDCIAWHEPTIFLIDGLTEEVIGTAMQHCNSGNDGQLI